MARKILLADDSVTAQNMGRKILADAGYEVSTVNNGSAALKRITEIKPDLIVLDVYMPGYSGLEVCQRLKEAAETAHIPVLLTVGKLEPFKPEEARRVRADAHIVKPFEASELLTAITRLEDRMVPPQADGSRFATSVSGVERFGGEAGGRKTEGTDDSDTGWKSRLRFPSKKKKEEPEPEPEDVTAAATFRDFRKTKGKSGSGLAFTVKEKAPAGQEPGLVPDIPRDITPEELDALSALAAKLDGPIPAAEKIAPLAGKTGPEDAAAAVALAKAEAVTPTEAVKAEVEVRAELAVAPVEANTEETEIKTQSAVVETAAVPALAVETSAVEAKGEVVIPVEHTEAVSEIVAAVTEAAASEIQAASDAGPKQAAIAEGEMTVTVNTAALVEPPAPVDRTDEPKFDLVASAIALAAKKLAAEEKNREEKIREEKNQEAKIQEERIASVAESQTAETVASAASDKDKIEQPVPVAEIARGTATAETTEAQEAAPSDEELAEALRLLTPSISNAEATTIPSHGTLVAAGQLLAEEVARNAAAGPRWIAEAVAPSAEEAALSLEAEMFRTFAATPAASAGEPEAIRVTGVSAIAAAVENRLAAFDLKDSAKSDSQPGPESRVESPATEASVETRSEENKPEENRTSSTATATTTTTSTAADGAVPEQSEAKPVEEVQVTPEPAAKNLEAATKDVATMIAEEAPADEYAGGTFADAVGNNDAVENHGIEASTTRHEESVHETTVVAAESVTVPEAVTEATSEAISETTEGSQDSSSDFGGEDVASKSGKSTWHQIRTGPTSAAAAGADVVEAAKQAQDTSEETPKAMAAAAADGSSVSTSASATDAKAIASIVDSVMADLRPKIVEEIAKKLAGK